MRRMWRAAVLAGVLVLVAAGAAAGSRTAPAGTAAKAAPTPLTIWVGWSARELSVFKSVVAEYDKKNPNVTVNVVGSINDNKIVAAIRAGTAPDVVSSFNSYNVGIYCGTGGWINLAPLMAQSHISASMFPAATRYYTQYKRRPLRAAAARRHVRPLLQQGPVQGGRDHEPAEDDVGARSRREEADGAELERHDQGRRHRPDDRLLRERAGAVDHVLRRQVAGREGQLDPLEGPRMGEVAELAQGPRRLVRVQQPREVPGRAR